MRGEQRRQGRQRILDGAAHILDTGQLSDFTVDTLARNLHMSKSTLYKYFQSKDDVVITLVGNLYGRTDQELDALDVDESPSALEALSDVAGILADHADRVPTSIMLEAPALPGGSEQRIDRTRLHLCGRLEEAMARGLDDGEFDIVDARMAASAFLAAAEKAVAVSSRNLPDLSQGDAVRAVLDMMVRGIARA